MVIQDPNKILSIHFKELLVLKAHKVPKDLQEMMALQDQPVLKVQ